MLFQQTELFLISHQFCDVTLKEVRIYYYAVMPLSDLVVTILAMLLT